MEGGLVFRTFESEPYDQSEGVRSSEIRFEDVLAVSKVEPAELKKEGTKHQKENIGKMAEYLRTHLINFLVKQDGIRNSQLNTKHLLLFAGYFAALCAMTVLVMLVPGVKTLSLAWPVVTGLGLLGFILTRFNVIWLLAWIYTMLLLLLPGSIMANSPPASHWPNAAGYGFVFVLWCSGWVFMWVQGKGDQHALACVRTVVWDESTNAATTAVPAAFHISMTKPQSKNPLAKKNSTASGQKKDQEEWEFKLAGKAGLGKGLGTKKKKRTVLATRNCDPNETLREGMTESDVQRHKDTHDMRFKHHPEEHMEPFDEDAHWDIPDKCFGKYVDNPDRDQLVLQQLMEENPALRRDVLAFLEFELHDEKHNLTRIALESGPNEDGWCVGHLVADELTDDQLGLMARMPSGLTMQIKLWTAAYEGFAYCSFAFFPAMPWESVKVPPNFPPPLQPQNFFLAGIFEFKSSPFVQLLIFIGAFVFVPAAFLVLYLYRNNVGKKNLVIEVAFAALTFPVIKRFTDVFACTSGKTLVKNKELMQFERLCETPAPLFEDCMDVAPEVPCWSQEHHLYILGVMCMLVPYYIGSLIVRSNSQAKSSAVIIDGIYAIMAFQLKVVLAVLASGWGDCHPVVLIAGVETVVIIMALMSMEPAFFRRRYSNVLELNAVRATGLMAAALNGFYAVYITARYGEATCNPDSINSTYFNASETFFDKEHGLGPKTQTSVLEFFVLLGINFGTVLGGYFTYWWKKRQLVLIKSGQEESVVEKYSTEVDYQLCSWRLEVEKKSDFEMYLSEFRDEAEAKTTQQASGQQIEEVTLNKVLFTERDVNNQRKTLFNNPWQVKTLRVKSFDVRTEGGHRLAGKLKSIVESRHPSTKVARFKQSIKDSINRNTGCMMKKYICCGKAKQCKAMCAPPGFAPYKMSVEFRRLKEALYGHIDSSDEEDDPVAEMESGSGERKHFLQKGRSRAKSMAHQAVDSAVAVKTVLVDNAITQGVKKGTLATAALAKKGLQAVPLMPNISRSGPKLVEDAQYIQLLKLLVQVPDLTSLDIRGCDYPLELFLQDAILDEIQVDSKGRLMTDLSCLTIDFRIAAADRRSYVTIHKFATAKAIVERLRDAAGGKDGRKQAAWDLSSMPEQLCPEHLYLVMGYMKMCGTYSAAVADDPQTTPTRGVKSHTAVTDGMAGWAPHLVELNLSGNSHLIGEGHTHRSLHGLKGVEHRALHKLSHQRTAVKGAFDLATFALETADIVEKARDDKEEVLHAEGTQAQTMDIWKQLCEGLRENTKVRHLRFSDVGMGPVAMEIFVKELLHPVDYSAFGQMLLALDVSRNPLRREGKAQLAEALRFGGGLKNLEKLTISLGDDVSKSFQLNCTVLECRDLEDMDLGAASFHGANTGANDVYVTLSIKGEHPKRTSVIFEGGSAPKWSEELSADGVQSVCLRSFTWCLDHYTKMEVCVMDKDSVKSDDLLGVTTIDLSEKTTKAMEGDEAEGQWFSLNMNKKKAGQVKLKLVWKQVQSVPQTLTRSEPKLDLSTRSLSSQDTAFLSGWLHHCRDVITEVRVDGCPDFVGEKGVPGSSREKFSTNADEKFVRVSHFEEFCTALKETKVSSLKFEHIGMGPLATIKLYELLETPYGSKVKLLDVSANNLEDTGKRTVCDMIAKTVHLGELIMDLGNGPSGHHENTKHLKRGNGASCVIDFSDHDWKLQPADVNVVAAWTSHCKKKVTKVLLNNNESLANESSITTLGSDNAVVPLKLKPNAKPDPWSALCVALGRTEKLETLGLKGVGAGANCARVLAHVMIADDMDKGRKASTPLAMLLKDLDISCNPLPAEALELLVGPSGVLQGSAIEKLCVDLGDSTVTFDKAEAALKLKNRNLQPSDMITVAGWMLHCRGTIHSVDLSDNIGLISDEGSTLQTPAWKKPWEVLCKSLGELEVTDLSLAHIGLGAEASSELALALSSEDSKLRSSLIKLDISRNPLKKGKNAIFAAIPGTAISRLRVPIGSDEEAVLDSTDSFSIALQHNALQPEDAALLAGWTVHIKDKLHTIDLTDNPELVAAEEPELSQTFGPLMTAMHAAPIDTLRLTNTGMSLTACSLLAGAIASDDGNLGKHLMILDVGCNIFLTRPSLASDGTPQQMTLDVAGPPPAQMMTRAQRETKEREAKAYERSLGDFGKKPAKAKPGKGSSQKGSSQKEEESSGAPAAWRELCQAVKSSTVQQWEVNACNLNPVHAVEIADVLSGHKLKRLNLSGNRSLFGAGNDQTGWQALCAALSKKKCSLEDLVVSECGMGHNGILALSDALPKQLKSLNLSRNAIASRALIRVKTNSKGEERDSLNREHGGSSGHTGKGKIEAGVVCIDRESGRCYKVNSHHQGLTIGDTHAVELTDLQTDKDDIKMAIDHLLRTTNSYAKKDCEIGSYSHIKALWPALTVHCKELTVLNLSGCGMDCKSVKQLAGAVSGLQRLETVTLEATGHGPWRGLRGKHFDTREPSRDYTYTLVCGQTIELGEKALGPQDLQLVAEWLQLPAVSSTVETVILSGNDRLFGNSEVHEDETEIPNERGLNQGQWRILQPCVMRESVPNDSNEICHLEAGELVQITQFQAAMEHISASPKKKQKDDDEVEEKKAERTRLLCDRGLRNLRGETPRGWISDRNTEDVRLAERVRDHAGWEALCSAVKVISEYRVVEAEAEAPAGGAGWSPPAGGAGWSPPVVKKLVVEAVGVGIGRRGMDEMAKLAESVLMKYAEGNTWV